MLTSLSLVMHQHLFLSDKLLATDPIIAKTSKLGDSGSDKGFLLEKFKIEGIEQEDINYSRRQQ